MHQIDHSLSLCCFPTSSDSDILVFFLLTDILAFLLLTELLFFFCRVHNVGMVGRHIQMQRKPENEKPENLCHRQGAIGRGNTYPMSSAMKMLRGDSIRSSHHHLVLADPTKKTQCQIIISNIQDGALYFLRTIILSLSHTVSITPTIFCYLIWYNNGEQRKIPSTTL